MNRDVYLDMALRAMPGTVGEIAERMCVSKDAATHWTAMLRAAGWAHVSEWRRSEKRGGFQPVIAAGQGVNVACNLTTAPRKIAPYRLPGYVKRPREEGFSEAAAIRALQLADSIVSSGRRASPFDALFIRSYA